MLDEKKASPRRTTTIGRLLRWVDVRRYHFNNWLNIQRDARYRDNHVLPGARLNQARLEGNVSIGERVQLSGDVFIGAHCTIDRDSIIRGGTIRIGRYTQAGADISIYAVNHATNLVSIYNNATLFERRLKAHNDYGTITIGSDVWIGYNAIILNNVTIGTGAVIGAGAVVTKDVPPYGVAVGNPAKVIRQRFPDEVIELLLEWAWWELAPKALEPYEALFTTDLTADLDKTKQLLTEAIRRRRDV